VFRAYQSMAQYTRAAFLQDPGRQTPVFVRFSTVNGSRGSADTVRDARGFATKFSTPEGVFDLGRPGVSGVRRVFCQVRQPTCATVPNCTLLPSLGGD
jgi:hypothetical protein